MARHFTKKVLEAYNRTYVQPSDFKRLNLTYPRVPNKHVGNLILLLTFFAFYTFHLIIIKLDLKVLCLRKNSSEKKIE